MDELIDKSRPGQYVVFAINKQLCALSIEEVMEIIRIQPITDVPEVNDYIAGVINLRGNIIPVVNLRKRYGMEAVSFQKKTRIIIVNDTTGDIGLIVDEVAMVTYVEEENLEPPLDVFNSIEKECFNGFVKREGQLIGILNLKNVLYPAISKEV
ncbi:chemotaxis protein [Bacillus sp. FJAT-27231]|uniref:chemotaxis protein CheW n=1 Tax=Bacillus sp. FJAT-27231 TaxID=1679168 RepID=UPI000671431D|nr:chemotaxis protein CheW [Bacillus sp. FJAT-27231]KMY54255.1 chemotaxis protein [Bacillus sp. FJAT-27231]